MKSILNISAYRFVELNGLEALREQVVDQASRLHLRGTVLLAEEGINLFLAGPALPVNAFLDWLRSDPRFAALQAKESWSDAAPFGKLLVKIKPEIIRMNHPTIQPQTGRAPAVDPATLARWLDAGVDDAGRAVVLLDTRNDFEVGHGQFRGAVHWQLNKFSEFPAALLAQRESLQDKTVVSYCTGGIRCEKAALFMAESGLDHVLQLDGGILKYFEEVGQKHFDGDCFVFDERRTVDAGLQPGS